MISESRSKKKKKNRSKLPCFGFQLTGQRKVSLILRPKTKQPAD